MDQWLQDNPVPSETSNTTNSDNAVFEPTQLDPVNRINSPTRVVADIMFVFNERIINHFLKTSPGPATFFYLASIASFGSHLAPAAGLAWMHGLPQFLQQGTAWIGQNFTGASAGLFHEALSSLLAWKLCTAATVGILSVDKDGTVLDQLNEDPEKIIMGIVAFASIGYSLAFIPTLPTTFSIPGFGDANLYATVINMITNEARIARAGAIPLVGLEYGFLGFKCIKLLQSATESGLNQMEPKEFEKMMAAFKTNQVLAQGDEAACVAAAKKAYPNYDKVFKSGGLESAIHSFLENKAAIDSAAQELAKKHSSNVESAIQKTDDQLSKTAKPTNAQDALHQLQQEIALFTDPNCPMSFPHTAAGRADAKLYYNHISEQFKTYNTLCAAQDQINAEPFLKAFRNQYCSAGSNNLVRQLSFYPFYPIRYLWREAQLAMNPNDDYIKDKINASRAKDVVLRHQWTAMITESLNNVGNFNKAVVKFLMTGYFLLRPGKDTSYPDQSTSIPTINPMQEKIGSTEDQSSASIKKSESLSIQQRFEAAGARTNPLMDDIKGNTSKGITDLVQGSSWLSYTSGVTKRITAFFQRRGWLPDEISVLDPSKTLQKQTAKAAHLASNYSDVSGASLSIAERIGHIQQQNSVNHTNNTENTANSAFDDTPHVSDVSMIRSLSKESTTSTASLSTMSDETQITTPHKVHHSPEEIPEEIKETIHDIKATEKAQDDNNVEENANSINHHELT